MGNPRHVSQALRVGRITADDILRELRADPSLAEHDALTICRLVSERTGAALERDPIDGDELLSLLTYVCGSPCRDDTLQCVRFRCPVCLGGFDDPLGLYRPLVVDDDGSVWCDKSLPRGQDDDLTCWFTPDTPMQVLLAALHTWRTTPWAT